MLEYSEIGKEVQKMRFILMNAGTAQPNLLDGNVQENISRMQVWLNEAADWCVGYLPNLIAALVMLIGGYWIIRLLTRLLSKALERSKADATITSFLVSVARTALWICLSICILAALRFNVATLIAALSAAVVTVGLAIKDSLANVASGTLIILNRKFKTGDFIETEGIIGEVMKIDMMYTTLRTYDHKEVLIPNSRITSNNVINHFNLGDRRLEIPIPIAYEQDIAKAKKVIMDYVDTVDKVLKDKPNKIIVDRFGESSVDMILYVWCESEHYWPVIYEVREGVKNALDQAGIAIPFNQLDVHMIKEKSGDDQ